MLLMKLLLLAILATTFLFGSDMETPPFLYKILSYKNWQASQARQAVILTSEDEAFIHFSTDEQLERILNKFWKDAPQVVILKIDTVKLVGRLVFETNPGGSGAKYYHLYEGLIPFESIVEAKTIFKEPLQPKASTSLKIVQIGDPVLRQVARALSQEEILSPRIQKLIQDMKETMRSAPGVGLAAPQIGESIQLAVIEDMDQSALSKAQIEERERYPVPFHVIINPSLYIEEEEVNLFFEGCLSVPVFTAVVPRAKSVRVECLNEKGEPQTIHAKGWYARILQHEIDHLNGYLMCDRAYLQTLSTTDNFIHLWRTKPVQEVLDTLSHQKCGCK